MTGMVFLLTAALYGQAFPDSGAVSRDALLAAWQGVGAYGDPAAAAFVEGAVVQGDMTREGWHETFALYYLNAPFTANHEQFLSYLLTNSGRFDASLAMAVAATGEGLAAGPWNNPEGFRATPWADNGEALLRWTHTLITNLPAGTAQTTLREGFSAAFRGSPLAFRPFFEAPVRGDLAVVPMRLVLLLATVAGRGELENWVEMPSSMTALYRDSNVLLWDGGALSSSQTGSLNSLYKQLPQERHGIGLVVVSEAVGLRAASLNSNVPPFAVDLTAAPLSTLAMGVSPIVGMESSVPLFTLQASEQIVRAMAYRASFERPEIGYRRDLILSRAGQVREAFVTAEVPGSPEELLPRAMFAWTADSVKLLERSRDRANDGYLTVVESLFLLADLLSGGTDTAPALSTSVTGVVTMSPATLHRTPFQDGVFVTGITVGGLSVRGSLDGRGYIVQLDGEE